MLENVVAIILARSGSKGIPNKNIKDFCGKPLLAWTIEHAKNANGISSVWVSSDSEEILEISKKYGANIINRPIELAEDTSTSESGWLQALEEIEKTEHVDLIVALQATSPVRESKDIEQGLKDFKMHKCDSLFSCTRLTDFTIWQQKEGIFNSLNFDYKNRLRRQDIKDIHVLENGSFYIFKPDILRKNHNRFGGKIGITEMEVWKSFEIDNLETFNICELLMKNYILKNNPQTYLESLFSMKGKISLVTGAARGNGRAIAEALLRAGSTVILVDLLSNELSKTVESFRSESLDAIMYTCDITKNNEIYKLSNFVVEKFNKIDVLINNAGVTFPSPTLDYPEEYWETTYKVNLKAPFELSKAFGRIMRENTSGVIINITTIGSHLAFPDNPSYGAFKAALRHLTKTLALDLGKYGIRVNNLSPGYMKTNMTKKSWDDPVLRKNRTDRTVLGRWGESNDLAGAILFLSSDASAYVTGVDLLVDGGWAIKGL